VRESVSQIERGLESGSPAEGAAAGEEAVLAITPVVEPGSGAIVIGGTEELELLPQEADLTGPREASPAEDEAEIEDAIPVEDALPAEAEEAFLDAVPAGETPQAEVTIPAEEVIPADDGLEELEAVEED
jgi:hypothetical protein